MNAGWIGSVQALFVRVYGEGRGTAVCNVVIPAVLGDFRKTALRAEPGRRITEQYRTDDRRTDVTVTGRRESRNGADACVVERITVGGLPADLGGELVL